MSDNVITNLEQVTTEWLTAVLTQNGALTQGRVTTVTVDPGRGNWSESGSLQLAYSPDAQGERPSRLFLKMVNTDLGDGEYFGPLEVEYYTMNGAVSLILQIDLCQIIVKSPIKRETIE